MEDKEKQKLEKKEYYSRKEQMLEYEKRNYTSIVLFRATNGFYIAGGHSAVILYNLIAPELGLKIAITKDRDFDFRFTEGVVMIRNTEKYKQKLPQSVYIKGFEETENRLAFKLSERLPKEKYKILASSEKIKREELLNMVSSSKVMPKTYQSLREIMKLTYKAVEKRSDAVSRTLLTGRLVEEARTALSVFLNGCRSYKSIGPAMDKVEKLLNQMLVELIVIEAAEVWHMSQCRKISFAITKALQQLAVERKEYE